MKILIKALTVLMLIVSSVQADWVPEYIDQAQLFTEMTDRSLALDKDNKPHIAYGQDHLYHAWFDGAQWQSEVVDSESQTGKFASIAVDNNGAFHISYFDDLNNDLKYATNRSGAWVTSTLDAEGNVGEHTSIAVDNNLAVHISYYSVTAGAIKYITNKSGKWASELINDAAYPGHNTLALDAAGNAHIAGNSQTTGGLTYYNNVNGKWEAQTVASLSSTATYCSLLIDRNGHAHISYYDNTYPDRALKYATNQSGSWNSETIDATSRSGMWSSIAMNSVGDIHVCYYDGYRLNYATNRSGSWSYATIGSTKVSNGLFGSIAVDSEDKVHISHFARDYTLRYITDISGSWETTHVVQAAMAGHHSSLLFDTQNNAHIIYSRDLSGKLMHATDKSGEWELEGLNDESGSRASVFIDGNDTLHVSYRGLGGLRYGTLNSAGEWQSEALFNTYNNIYYSAIVADANGKAHIVFSQYGKLKHFTNASGIWIEETIYEPSSKPTMNPSLAIDSNGYLHLSAMRDSLQNLIYANNTAGNWTIETLDVETMSYTTRLILDSNDRAHIIYGNGPVRHAHNSTGNWEIELVSADTSLYDFSVAVDSDDRLHTVYYKRYTQELLYNTNASGSWLTEESYVDLTGWTGAVGTSLAFDHNKTLHASYYDAINFDLKYATLEDHPGKKLGKYPGYAANGLLCNKGDNGATVSYDELGNKTVTPANEKEKTGKDATQKEHFFYNPLTGECDSAENMWRHAHKTYLEQP